MKTTTMTMRQAEMLVSPLIASALIDRVKMTRQERAVAFIHLLRREPLKRMARKYDRSLGELKALRRSAIQKIASQYSRRGIPRVN